MVTFRIPALWRGACLTAAMLVGLAAPAGAENIRLDLHPGRPGQDQIGKLVWRGGVEVHFDEPGFGGISAMEPNTRGIGGGTMTLLTDRGDVARIEMVEDAAGNLIDVRLLSFGPLTGAGGRVAGDATGGDAEAIAGMPDGGWIVAFEGRHRLLHFPASGEPLRGVPRLINAPRGLERAAGDHGIKAASELRDRKVLLIADYLPTMPGFTMAWIGNGADWTPMSYAIYRPFQPAGAAMLPNGDVAVVENNPTSRFGGGSRIALIRARNLRAGAPIQTEELAQLKPPYVSGNFEAIAATRTLSGRPQIYLASDNGFDENTPTVIVKFDVLP